MNNNHSRQINTVINVKEIIWDLFEQWKAILITALLMMALVAGVKYTKDIKAYNASQAEKGVENQVSTSAEERIAAILDALPDEERSTVVTIVKQKEWIESEKDYINNSILMNTDPTNQRTLVADYYIKSENDSSSVRDSLIYGYRSYLKDAYVSKALGKVIAPDAKINYIAELIRTDDSAYTDEIDLSNTILQIYIVLPDDTNVQEVEETLTTLIKEQEPEISRVIAPHSIDLVNVSEAHLYNSDAVKNRTEILYSIYNLQNNTKNMQTSLSDGQKAAIEAITEISTAEKIAVGDDESGTNVVATEKKPGISRKYAALGFVLGVMLYAFIYLVLVIIKGRITCAADAEYYTQSRLLGEVYHQTQHKGLDVLMHSKLVDRCRYREKLDEDDQIQKTASKLDTTCRHIGTENISVLCMSELSEVSKKIIDAIKSNGLDVSVDEIPKETNDGYMLSVKDAVLLVDDEIKVADLASMTNQLKDYDVNLIGSIYYKCI